VEALAAVALEVALEVAEEVAEEVDLAEVAEVAQAA